MMPTTSLQGERLLALLRGDFIGLDTSYRVADGRVRRRVYLDTAATSLMLSLAHQTATAFLRHNANVHSRIHFSARVATEACAFARERVLSFVGADPEEYVCLFIGSGATGALNRSAHYLRGYRPTASTVLVSLMEHHSNDLPHRRLGQVRHIPLRGTAPALGAIDVDAFEELLRAEPIGYAAITMVSNVTGIVNPIARLSAVAHEQRVPVLIDASQAIAHLPLSMGALGDPDALVFSGHKIYAPGSPGVLIVRREIVEAAEPAELGGGMVGEVTTRDFTLATELAQREEAGTPNVLGAVTLSAALEVLGRIGMETIAEHERALTRDLLDELLSVPGLRVYGSTDLARWPRSGVVSFNLGDLDHGFVTSILNDYYNIAVRNQCFCAQPYAQTLLAPELWDLDVPDDPGEAEVQVGRRRGMVRASLAMHSTPEDIAMLGVALREIQANAHRYRQRYRIDDRGDYCHARFAPADLFDIPATVDGFLRRAAVGTR
jgi:cysteine desulfurase / selenocysteine lyase